MPRLRITIILLFNCCLMYTSLQNYTETKIKINELSKKHDMLFGVSSASYQIEGAWNESGKAETIWDRFIHENPKRIADQSNADVSCDSYHNIDRDIEMLKYLGVEFYRFSISWARVAPMPMSDTGNAAGLKYYQTLIDKLISNNIVPIVTLFHFDLPQNIQDFGGWTNELIVDYFENYARIVFDNFADKVKIWVTFNEPDNICHDHVGLPWPPIFSSTGLADYLCMRNLFLAHARVYHLYRNVYDTKRKGMIGSNISFNWVEPPSNATEDIEAVDRFSKMFYGLHVDPIYADNGDYPELLKNTVAKKSKAQGFHKSRLPEFTKAEIEYIRNTYDFLGINYYTTKLISRFPPAHIKIPSFQDDVGHFELPPDPTWKNTSVDWLMNHPEGFRKILNYIKKTYHNPKVMILENGCGTSSDAVDNLECVAYFKGHLDALYDAVTKDGCNVVAYSAWCLMDNFEWEMGYSQRFGLFYTDFQNDARPVTPKATAKFFKEVLTDVDENFRPDFDGLTGRGNMSSCMSLVFFVLFSGFFVRIFM